MDTTSVTTVVATTDFELITPTLVQLFYVITGIISISSAIASVWKQPSNSILAKIHATVNLIALNVGAAKNKN